MKNALLDRIGCGLAARRLSLGQEISSYVEQSICTGDSSIWGTDIKTQAHLAALVNGASSSHLEYDSHDSMVPALIALGEQHGASGKLVLHSMKIGYYTSVFLRKILATNIEKRGLHWPAYIAAFISSAACSNMLGLTGEETANAMGIAASLSPAAPFESFTRGASVKDLYGGWGNMLGVQSTQLSGLGMTGPDTLFEGKRGLFRNWLNGSPDSIVLESALNFGENEMRFHIKPFPSCTSAHPTLSALENIIVEHPSLDPNEIEGVEVVTYRFGADLSDESDPNTPIGAKVNIPFLTASMLIHRVLLPEHSERPWIHDSHVQNLAERIHVSSENIQDELLTRKRMARVIITMNNGEYFESCVRGSKWSKTCATRIEIQEKFRANVGNLFSVKRVEQLISMVGDIENPADISDFAELLRSE